MSMNFEILFYVMLIMALVSSISNVLLYSVGYYKVRKSKVDGELRKIKKIMLLDLLTVFFVALCFAIVFAIVIFAPQYTTPALYFLGIVLFGLNVAYNIKAVSLASIVEGYTLGK